MNNDTQAISERENHKDNPKVRFMALWVLTMTVMVSMEGKM